MPNHLAGVVERLAAARARRGLAPDRAAQWDDLLGLLQAEHAGPGEDLPVTARLASLAEVFSLVPLDLALLVVAVAPELDPNLGTAMALLQGDASRLRPSAGLALELAGAPLADAAARARLGPASPLRRHRLLEVDGDSLLLDRAVRVPDRVVAHLLGDDSEDPALASLAVEPVHVPLPEAVPVARALEHGVPLVWVRSGPGSAAVALAVDAFTRLGIAVVAVDLRRCAGPDAVAAAVRDAVREAGLRAAGLLVAGADALAEPGATWLLELLDKAPVPVVAVASRSWDAGWLRSLPYAVDAPPTPREHRAQLWQRALGGQVDEHDRGWAELVALRLTPEEIAQTSRCALQLAAAGDRQVSIEAAREAARRLSTGMAGARRARAAPTFDDLVLPTAAIDALHELVDWARHRDEVLAQGPLAGKGDKGRGISALFAGSPGTGKTLAAHVIAAELGLDLHTVELSSIVDKYIGETEKNLEKVFAQAESLNVLLFFDEADALFGARSEVRDARDRYANQEVAYLLQRMEQFDGIAVLATNLRGNLDVAFSRRLHFVVHFPDPDVVTRRSLWESHIAALARTDPQDPVDLDHLAETVEVAGGDIRNVVLAAAYAAAAEGQPVGMQHVVSAVVREYRKLGRRLPVPGLRTPVQV